MSFEKLNFCYGERSCAIDEPELANDDPHGEGWLVKIRMGSVADLHNLMNAEKYEEYVKSGEA